MLRGFGYGGARFKYYPRELKPSVIREKGDTYRFLWWWNVWLFIFLFIGAGVIRLMGHDILEIVGFRPFGSQPYFKQVSTEQRVVKKKGKSENEKYSWRENN